LDILGQTRVFFCETLKGNRVNKGQHRKRLMRDRKFSDQELSEKLKEGKSLTLIAKELGVTKGSVCKRRKKLKAAIATNATMHYADGIVRQQIDANEQLLKISASANTWLDRLENMRDRKQEEIISGISEEIMDLLPGLRGEIIVSRLKALVLIEKDMVDQVLKFLAEIRQQLRFMFEVHEKMVDAREFKEFKDSFLAEIGLEQPEVRDRIIARLQKLQAMRSSIGWPEAGRFTYEAMNAA